MSKPAHIRILYVLILLAFSCEKIPFIEASDLSWELVQTQLEEDGLRSEQRFRPSSMSAGAYRGAINAVKKAYQLTDVSFIPLQPIAYNKGEYQPNTTYKGMIYSSVKEIGTYVGSNISIHTFMTAVHNPRSRIYTDRIDESPYNGTNCRSYYGTVCSAMVSYALGLVPIHATYDFLSSPEMEELDYSAFDDFHIADVLWRSGHVAMITDVVRAPNDSTMSIEISEAIMTGCKRYMVSRSSFQTSFSNNFKRRFRYKSLDQNINYLSVPEFVPVFDEKEVPFKYNNDICVDKGDKSCYFVGEDVVLNVLSMGDAVDIYRDGIFQKTIELETEDIRLTDLPYGLYQARLVRRDGYSDFTSWIVVDGTIVPARNEMRIYCKSDNSTPISVFFCGKTGGRSYSIDKTICREVTEEEITKGYIEISSEKKIPNNPYFIITFATEFGNISTTPIEWK